MSPDVRTRLCDLAEAMPAAPGDLGAVQHRARRRGRRARAAVVLGAVVLVLVVVTVWRLPVQPPPVIEGDHPSTLRLHLCRPPMCPPETNTSLEQVLATLRDDPAVGDLEVVDIETQRREVAEAHDMTLEELPADMFTPVVRVAVQPGEDDLVTVARRLREALPGVGVRRGSGAAEQMPEDLDPRAAVGPSHDVVEVDVGSVTVTARMWPVEGAGRCVGVEDLVSCDTDALLVRGEAAGEAWGRPAPGVTCVWSSVADQVERISVTFANGAQVDGTVGDAPPGVLAGVGMACVDARTHPTTIDYPRAVGGSSTSGMAPWSEVRPPGVPGWSDVTEMFFDQFPEDRAEELAASDDPADRRDDLAAAIADLELPEGIEELRVYDTSSGVYRPGDDGPSTQVAAEVTTTRGDKICMVALLYDADDEPTQPTLMLDRPVVWTPEDGCPPLP